VISRRFLRDLCIVLGGIALAIWAVTTWVAVPWVVEGSSMEPTLHEGDRVVVDLWTPRRRPPLPGEIVLLRSPEGDALVKRVVRDPPAGELELPPSAFPPGPGLDPTYIVLGDNPSASRDSREFGRVPLNRVRGRVAWRYWPLSRLGAIE